MKIHEASTIQAQQNLLYIVLVFEVYFLEVLEVYFFYYKWIYNKRWLYIYIYSGDTRPRLHYWKQVATLFDSKTQSQAVNINISETEHDKLIYVESNFRVVKLTMLSALFRIFLYSFLTRVGTSVWSGSVRFG